MNPHFDGFILIVIILNTVFLALDKYPELNDEILQVLVIQDYIFNFVFTFEMILKQVGFGFKLYFQDKFN